MKINKLFTPSIKPKHPHPIVFMFLFLPFGVMNGYVSVTIGFLLTKAGIP